MIYIPPQPTWFDVVLRPAIYAIAAEVARAIAWLFLELVFSQDRYDSVESSREASWVIGHVAHGAPNGARIVVCLGQKFMLSRRVVSAFTVIKPWTLVRISQIERGLHGQVVEHVHVYRPRWVPSLVPLPLPGEVNVLEVENNNKYAGLIDDAKRFDHSGVPTAALAFANNVADLVMARRVRVGSAGSMEAAFPFRSTAYCSHGGPGTGKTIAGEKIGEHLSTAGYKVTLYTGYNSKKAAPGHSLREHIRNYTGLGCALVVMADEFEEMLAFATAGKQVEGGMSDDYSVDADSKIGWVGLLDCLSKSQNVIMVFTTNKTKEQICLMLPLANPDDPSSAIDISFVRQGRISGHLVQGENNTAVLLPPIDAEFAASAKLACSVVTRLVDLESTSTPSARVDTSVASASDSEGE